MQLAVPTMDAKNSIVNMVTIRNGRFNVVGNTKPPAAAQLIDLRGRTVVPGRAVLPGAADAVGGHVDAAGRLVDALGAPRTVGAAVEASADLDAVADHPAPAVLAHGRQLVGGALETIERMGLPRGDYLKRQVVVIAAHLTSSH